VIWGFIVNYGLRYDSVSMKANYSRVRFIGSCLLGSAFALMPTFLFYKGTEKAQTLLIFVPLSVVFTRIVMWSWCRSETTHADTVRRRYEHGDIPLGGVEVDRVPPHHRDQQHRAKND
jgi:hypothetical protein